MTEPRNEFERRAQASQAAADALVPSAAHRRWVWALGGVCLLLWAFVAVILMRDGPGAVPVVTIMVAVSNSALFVIFMRRLSRTGTPWRRP